jgi:ribonuclease BN (tRNA processing enzyme)
VIVTVLGCSGTYPGPDSACSGYLFEAEGFRLLVDAGNGVTGAMQRYAGIRDIDATMISHLHGDHFLDLVTYTYARRYHPDGELPPLKLYGPPGMLRHLAACYARPVDDLLAQVYDVQELSVGTMEVGPFKMDLARVNHPVETFAMRIEHDGRAIAYSADSAACDDLVQLARGANIFICEASYLDGQENPPDVHMTGIEAGQHATRADAGLLVLTHLVPWGDPVQSLQEAHESFAGDIALASTGARYEV